MLSNYLKIAIRNLWKNKLFSFVNIFGLSLSMAVGLLLFTKLKENHDTDHFHPNLDRICRIITKETIDNKQSLWASTPLPIISKISNTSFVDKMARVRQGGSHKLQTNKGDLDVEITFSESSFFEVFGFKLASGSPKSLESNINSVFLGEKTAEKIFGKSNPIGKGLQFENLGLFTVAGIIKKPLLESHIHIEAMFSLAAAKAFEKKGLITNKTENWSDYKTSYTYVLLKSGQSITQLKAILAPLKHQLDKTSLAFTAQYLEEITPWNPAIQNDNYPGMNNTGILTLLFLILALTILSAFNFISLSLARSLARAQEVGIRKAAGASRPQLIIQFLIEAIVIAFTALFFSFLFINILYSFMPFLTKVFKLDWLLVFGLLAYTILTGLVAGAIPAWLLSAFQPIQVLRKLKNIKLLKGISIYKSLIVVQFSVTIMLTIFFVILTDYERKTSKTISEVIPPSILNLDLKGEAYQGIKNEIEQLSQAKQVYATNWLSDAFNLNVATITANQKNQKLFFVSIDPKIIDNERVKLKLGQNFPKKMPQNIEQYVLLNEEAAKLLQRKNKTIIGENILIDSANVQVIGIMPNQIVGRAVPIIFRYLPKTITTLSIEVEPKSEKAALLAIQKIWKANFPQKTASIANLKDRHSAQNSLEMISFFGFFAFLVMIIACLGILGIASYAVEVRTKELGIRKILGANKAKLIWTISKNFGFLLILGGVVGIPAGLFCGMLLRDRMGSFVDLGLVNLGIGFVIVAVSGLLTVLSQTIKAGNINVSKVLKAD